MAFIAPQPEQPSATEVANWQIGRQGARQQYLNQQAQSAYNVGQAQLTQTRAMQQQNFNAGQQRRTFDDPYIARGIFNSGIRTQGLQDWNTQQLMNVNNIGDQYSNAIFQQQMQDREALQARNDYLLNSQLQEDARRLDLQSQIKGIL